MKCALSILVFLALTSAAWADPTPQERALLVRLVLAEARGEGELGMAAVARSVLNRAALVADGLPPGTYNARGRSLTAIINARGQYEPVATGTINNRRTAAQLREARAAVDLALDTERLRRRLTAALSAEAADDILSSTGFRARSAFADRSQQYQRQRFGQHVFNGDRFSVRRDVEGAFDTLWSTPRRRGAAGRLSSAFGGGDDAADGATASGGAELAGSGPSGPARRELSARSGGNVRGGGARGGVGARAGARAATRGGAGDGAAAGTSTGADPSVEKRLAKLENQPPAMCERHQCPQPCTPLSRSVQGGRKLTLGARGPKVEELQRRIGTPQSGLFGARTQRALERWQSSNGSEPTGEVDAPTLERLQALTEPLASPRRSNYVAYERGRRLGTIEVITIDGKPVAVETARAFLRMRDAARAAGLTLRINSGFRSMAEQRRLYERYRSGRGALAARPGYSNHQSGRALDISTGAGVGAWLQANAPRFGFRRTVPSEPWHWVLQR